MKDKRFDSTPTTSASSVVHEHRRTLRNGIEVMVREHLRRYGLKLGDISYKPNTSEIRVIDISPKGRPGSFSDGYELVNTGSDDIYVIYDKSTGTKLTGGAGKTLTSDGSWAAVVDLSDYLELTGTAFVPDKKGPERSEAWKDNARRERSYQRRKRQPDM